MNKYAHTRNNEQRPDERPFAHILKRALPPREDESTDTAQHRSDAREYRITIEHGSIRIGQECAASALPDAYY